MWKQYLKDYFSFTARERSGIFMLITFVVILNVLPFFQSILRQNKKQDKEYLMAIKALERDSVKVVPMERTYGKDESDTEVSLVSFDPNTISKEEWIQLGIREKTAQTIQNYLSRGGYFRSADDLLKIYGLHEKDVIRLKPFVIINKKPEFKREEFTGRENKPYFTSSKSTIQNIIEINSADTTQFISLPGIGSRLALRIITFRERLGGFYSVDQVGETYFLPDSTFRKIKRFLRVDAALIRKINVNKADFSLLRSHPYIDKNLANAILQFKKQHGDFSSVEELKKIEIMDDKIFNKISQYLTTE